MAFAKPNIATSVSDIANPISVFTINTYLASPLFCEYVKDVKLMNIQSAALISAHVVSIWLIMISMIFLFAGPDIEFVKSNIAIITTRKNNRLRSQKRTNPYTYNLEYNIYHF